ncbi:MAG: DUF362 domain-containing protein [Halobacteriaceae archaeon]
MFERPDPDALRGVPDIETGDLPAFAPVERHRDQPTVEDVPRATREALSAIDLSGLDSGDEVAVAAGSRGIHDVATVVGTVVAELQDRGFAPFVFPAMGSHGGATPEGQRETLASVGITEESVGCEIRASMAVEVVGEDGDGRPVVVAADALAADAILLVNRVKLHTNFSAAIESGLCKMAVVGMGKQRGAAAAHKTAKTVGFDRLIPEWAAVVFEAAPVVGGVAILENADERTAAVEGVPVEEILDREPALLDRARELQPMLPVDDLDLLVVDEIGKNISGPGMDTNVIGRLRMESEPDPAEPSITRIYVRSLTEETHGNGNGTGLADFLHESVLSELDLTDTYVNCLTAGQPARGFLPVVVPDDETALRLAYSTTGVTDPDEFRAARIQNTLEPDDLLVSEPVAAELRGRENFTVGEPAPLRLDGGSL